MYTSRPANGNNLNLNTNGNNNVNEAHVKCSSKRLLSSMPTKTPPLRNKSFHR